MVAQNRFSSRVRRYCEECGQPIDSPRDEMTLCAYCFRQQRRRKRAARKSDRSARRTRQIEYFEVDY